MGCVIDSTRWDFKMGRHEFKMGGREFRSGRGNSCWRSTQNPNSHRTHPPPARTAARGQVALEGTG